MNTTEQAVMLVEAGKRAAEALAPVKLPGTYPRISLGCGVPAPLVRAIAQVMGAKVAAQGYQGASGPEVLESADMSWEGVTLSVQGSRPLTAEDLPKAPTCSECKGPLDDEARYGPEGTARCEGCAEKSDEDESRPYRGNVRAEERAIDAGIRGGA